MPEAVCKAVKRIKSLTEREPRVIFSDVAERTIISTPFPTAESASSELGVSRSRLRKLRSLVTPRKRRKRLYKRTTNRRTSRR
jgi:hypothetical protein